MVQVEQFRSQKPLLICASDQDCMCSLRLPDRFTILHGQRRSKMIGSGNPCLRMVEKPWRGDLLKT